MKSEIIEVCGIKVNFTRKKIKNMHIRISASDGKVSVSAPFFVSFETVKKFVESREEWIKKNTERIKENKETENGDTVLFCGTEHILEVIKHNKNSVEVQNGKITVFSKNGDEEQIKKLLDAFFKQSLVSRAEKIIPEVEEQTGLYSSSLVIRNMKSRWGSCNTKTGRICLNLALSRYDDSILRYVITHEILHIKYPNHGSEFKAELSKYCKDWKKLREKLNGK